MGAGCGSRSKGLVVAHTVLVATFKYLKCAAAHFQYLKLATEDLRTIGLDLPGGILL
jgi:hypothetical protein